MEYEHKESSHTSKYTAMKTYLLTILLILGISVAGPGKPINQIYSVGEPAIQEEAYINDIPFDTELIANEALFEGYEAELKEEPYCDDIPFSTRKIACKYLLCKMMANFCEEEVDDIPFDTRAIYQDCMVSRMTMEFRQEANQQDIDWDTRRVANASLLETATMEYRDEEEVADLPLKDKPIFSFLDESCDPSWVIVKIKSPKKINSRVVKLKHSEYTVIYPAKIEVPRVEWQQDTESYEFIVSPSFSL